MADKRFVLVVYDIPDNRRRGRLHKRLLDFGSPVQYSVFECLVSGDELARMKRLVLRLTSKRRDHVRIYQLCGTCLGKTWIAGGKEVLREVPVIIV